MNDEEPFEQDAIYYLSECLIDFLEEIILSAYKRGLRKDHKCSKLNYDDIIYIIKDDPKLISKVTRYLIYDEGTDLILYYFI